MLRMDATSENITIKFNYEYYTQSPLRDGGPEQYVTPYSDYSDEGRKEYSRREAACRRRRLKVTRNLTPEKSWPALKVVGLYVGPTTHYVKKLRYRNTEKNRTEYQPLGC